jgi:hypothetical protein
MVVVTLMSTAVLSVRGAMQDRRARAERAFQDARECVLAGADGPTAAREGERRQCRERARRAAELSLELPEQDPEKWELQAAFDELGSAIDSGNEQRLSSALDRASRAGRALGWPVLPARGQ